MYMYVCMTNISLLVRDKTATLFQSENFSLSYTAVRTGPTATALSSGIGMYV